MNYKIFSNSIEENKIPPETYKEIYKIIIENYATGEKLSKDELKKVNTITAYNNWTNMILTTKEYFIAVFYENKKIIGFISFMYDKKGLCLSEVQIKKEYQSANNNLKKMINVVLDNCNKEKSKNVYLTINPRNEKSKNALTHIGFYNAKGKNYKISYNDFEKRVTMNNVKY